MYFNNFVGKLFFVSILSVLFFAPLTTHAMSRFWRGNGGDANVSTAANWFGGVAPINGDDVGIATSTGTVYWDSAAPAQVRSITSTSTSVIQLARSVEATSSIEINFGTTLTASSSSITLTPSGSGPNAFKVFGTFNPNSSTVAYTSTSTTNVASTTFAVVSFGSTGSYSLMGSTTATSTLTIASGATLDTSGYRLNIVKASGTGATAPFVNSGTFTGDGATVAYAFQTGATDVAGGVYSTLSLGSLVTYTLVGSTTATSTLTIPPSTTLDLGGRTLTVTKSSGTGASAPFVNNGTFTSDGGTLAYSYQTGATDVSSTTFSALSLNGAATYSLVGSTTATSTLTIASGATLDTSGYRLNIVKASGTGATAPFVNSGTFTGDGATVAYAFQTGATDVAGGVYSTLSLGSAVTYTLVGSTTATSTFTIPNGTTLDMGGRTLTVTKPSGTGASAPFVNNGTFLSDGSTVTYAFQTGATDISSTTYSSLNVNGPATYSLVGSTTATSTITIASGATLDEGGYTLHLDEAQGVGSLAPLVNNGTFTSDGGTLDYIYQTGATEIPAVVMAALNLSGSAVYSLVGSTTATSTVVIASGATLSMGSYDFNMSGATFTNNGALTESGSGSFKMANVSAFISDSAYARVFTYANPGTAYVSVTDYNANKSGSALDTITVTVAASDPSNTLSVTLTESGLTSGIFRGSFPTVLVSTVNSSDSNLEINGNTLLSVTYTDARASGDTRIYTIPATGNQSTGGTSSGGSNPGSTGGGGGGNSAPASVTTPTPSSLETINSQRTEWITISPTAGSQVLARAPEQPKLVLYQLNQNGLAQALGSTREATSLLGNYKTVYGVAPKTDAQWTDAIRLAQGVAPVTKNAAAEKKVATTFKTLFNRAPTKSANDQSAVTMLAYGMRPAVRDLRAEQAGVAKFVKTYKKSPKTTADWNAVRAYAYSGI